MYYVMQYLPTHATEGNQPFATSCALHTGETLDEVVRFVMEQMDPKERIALAIFSDAAEDRRILEMPAIEAHYAAIKSQG